MTPNQHASSLPDEENFSHLKKVKKKEPLCWVATFSAIQDWFFGQQDPLIKDVLTLFFEKRTLFSQALDGESYLRSQAPMITWKKGFLPDSFSLFFLLESDKYLGAQRKLLNTVSNFVLSKDNIHLMGWSARAFSWHRTSPLRFFAGKIDFCVRGQDVEKVAKMLFPYLEAVERKPLDHAPYALDFALTQIENRFPLFFDTKQLHWMRKQTTLPVQAILALGFVDRKLEKVFATGVEERVVVHFFHCKQADTLGVALAFHLTPKYEHVDQSKFLDAIRSLYPRVFARLCFHQAQGGVHLFYLELQKSPKFSLQERIFLKKELKRVLKKRIEKLVPKVFANCREETRLKHLATLVREAAPQGSDPQVMIELDQIDEENIAFTILLARQHNGKSLERELNQATGPFVLIPGRYEVIGETLEAYAFRIEIPKTPDVQLLNGEIHFAYARKKIERILKEGIGLFRDYNGGLLEKKEEALLQLKAHLPGSDTALIEEFFYSLFPKEAALTTPTPLLGSFFSTMGGKFCPQRADKQERAFIQKKLEGFAYLSALVEGKLEFFSLENEPTIKAKFKEILENTRRAWRRRQEKKTPFELRISSPEVLALDPRKGHDRSSTTLIRLLFEGLTRFDREGNLILAQAKSYKLSDDTTRYTFTLKRSYWSNGRRVTAHDFVYAWRTALLKSDLPELFYPIKNALLVKQQKASIDQLGVKAKTPSLLEVELENPTPDFLERTAHTFYLPVPSFLDKKHPDWAKEQGEAFVCNGPFCLTSAPHGIYLKLKKNRRYFDSKRIELDAISVLKTSTQEGLRLVKEKKIDFFEVPTRLEGEFALTQNDPINISFLPAKILRCSLNTSLFPLNNLSLRKALAHSLNREKLNQLFPFPKKPALTVLPLALTEHQDSPALLRFDPEKAMSYFQKALQELGLMKRKLPSLTMTVPENDLRKTLATALKEQWEEIFGLHFRIEALPPPLFYKRRLDRRFHITLNLWGAPSSDPLSTLSAFRFLSDKINLCAFQAPHYQRLFLRAQKESDPTLRKQYSAQLEAILIRSACVLPLFYPPFLWLQSERIDFSPKMLASNGLPDFSHITQKEI